jgi:hypothetical protein
MRVTSHVHTAAIPLLSAVKPADNLSIEVTWKEGSRAPRTEKVDLAPLINSLKTYKRLRDNPTLFQSVHLLDAMGDIIAWGDDDEIDMDSSTIERLAEDMMTAAAFKAFLFDMEYTHTTAAAMLGYSRRQIENFISGESEIPRVCALACAALRLRNPEPPPRLNYHIWVTNWPSSYRDPFATSYGRCPFPSTSWHVEVGSHLHHSAPLNQASAGYDE